MKSIAGKGVLGPFFQPNKFLKSASTFNWPPSFLKIFCFSLKFFQVFTKFTGFFKAVLV